MVLQCRLARCCRRGHDTRWKSWNHAHKSPGLQALNRPPRVPDRSHTDLAGYGLQQHVVTTRRQPRCRTIGLDLGLQHLQQPAAPGSKPAIAGWIFGNGINGLVGQTIRAVIGAYYTAALRIPLDKPVHCADPDPSASSEPDRPYIRIGQPVPLRMYGRSGSLEAEGSGSAQ